jgi:hypothetical protein
MTHMAPVSNPSILHVLQDADEELPVGQVILLPHVAVRKALYVDVQCEMKCR